jgi:AraC-like DNA-binding protein
MPGFLFMNARSLSPRPGRAALALGEVVDLLRRAERVGASPADILQRAKAPYRLEELVSGAPLLIAPRHLVAIYRECVIAIGWHSSRADSKPQMHPAEFRLMCHCMLTAASLREAIDRQRTFFETRSISISSMHLHVTATQAIVIMDTLRRRRTYGGFLSDMVGMLSFSRFYAWLICAGDDLFQISLAHSDRYANQAITDFSDSAIRFGSRMNEIAFPAWLLDQPVIRSPAELERLLVDFPFDFLSKSLLSVPLKDRVRAIFALRIAHEEPLPRLEEIAAKTGQSLTTFRRRLAAEGTSVRILKDDVRREAALTALALRSRKIDDLSRLLGFRDVDCFRTAFRRWTGTVPTQKRRELLEDFAS